MNSIDTHKSSDTDSSARKKIRNIAIIAHVDHGKTTLVDCMLRTAGAFAAHEQPGARVMDSGDLERERGITILAKNTSVSYKGYRLNIVDTPGHADFGGEVERVLNMVDGVLLVVDAADGPMPQTRFVLRKALEKELIPVVVINKVDRGDARIGVVTDMIFDLFIELGANEQQLDFPILYASARDGKAASSIEAMADSVDVSELLDAIIAAIPAPNGREAAPLQILVANIEGDPYIGRVAIGRIEAGTIAAGQAVGVTNYYSPHPRYIDKISKLQRFEGLERVDIDSAGVGEIVCVAGIDDIGIGDTICDPEEINALPFTKVDEPTIAMTFSINNSPMAGRDGTYVTSRHLRARLYRELERNVSMQLEDTDSPDAIIVKGRGELHISILIETMRREGYEFQVSRPRAIEKIIDGERHEPMEEVLVEVPQDYSGVVIAALGARRGELVNMSPPEKGAIHLIFRCPSRGLIGYRTEFLTATRGHGIMNTVFSGYEPWKGELPLRNTGVLVASEAGVASAYGLFNAQSRGELFIDPGTEVYEGMVVGRSLSSMDIIVNVCRRKHATNIRAAGSDEALRLSPPIKKSLEQFLEFVDTDELLEVTPEHLRLRKRILNSETRLKARSRGEN